MVRDASGERAARMQWDERHRSGDFEGSGPNGTMVHAVGGWEPARALELACGSGTNAVWLARQGWQVTAVDWSPVALSNAQRQAHDAGVRISLLEKNLFDWTPPESAFELVLAVYLHLPPAQRLPVYAAAVRGLVPGGCLVVIGHDRSNAVEGQPSHPEPERLFTAAELGDELVRNDAGLSVERADAVRQQPAPEHNPIDALLVLRRDL